MGQVLASCSKVVNQAHSSSEVEAVAAGLVLSFAAELGVKNAVLEGDSLLVVKALIDSESSMSTIGPLINDAKYYSYSFEKLLYQEIIMGWHLWTSDQSLFSSPSTVGIVRNNARQGETRAYKFAAAMVKMGYVDVLTGSQDEIRKNCRFVN
nr:peroxidase 5-like [Quercus suber]